MSKKANPTLIGAFVVGAIVIFIAGLLMFGGGAFLKDTTQCMMYFDQTVGGLDVGAPIEFKGVKIGQVIDVRLVYNHKDDSISIPVIVEIDHDSFTDVDATRAKAHVQELKIHIDKGMRAQLQAQSLLTGKLKIVLDYHPGSDLVYHGHNKKVPEIPTIPGTLNQVMKRLAELPLDDIVNELHKAITSLANVLESGDLKKIMVELKNAVEGVSDLVNSEELGSTLKSLDETLAQTQELMASLNESAEPMRVETVELMQELAEAARSAQVLMDYLQRHPESLISGKKGE